MMGRSGVGTRTTNGTADSAITVESGETVYVHRVVLANNSASQGLVPLYHSDGTTLYFYVVAPANLTTSPELEFLADFGLVVGSVSNANLHVGVIHSAGGA